MSTPTDPRTTSDAISIEALQRELDELRAAQRAFVVRAGKLHRLMSSLGGTPSRAEVADIVVNQGRELCGAAATVIFFRRGDTLVLTALGDGDVTKVAPYAEIPLDAPQPICETVRTREPVWLPNREEIARRFPAVAAVDMHGRFMEAAVALPLLDEGEAIGGLVFAFYDPVPLDDLDRDFHRMVGELTSQALRRSRLLEAEAAARIAQQRRQERAVAVARAAGALASMLDARAAFSELARTVVPDLADWCAIDEAGPDGLPRRLAVFHRDPSMLELAEGLERKYPSDPSSPTSVAHVVRTGQRQLINGITDEMIVAGARDAEHLALVRSLRLRSLAILPMFAHGKVVGALTIVGEGERELDADDLAAADELGRHAALALENARLYAAAERERARMAALVLTTTAAVWTARADGTVVDLSPSWLAFTGQSATEYLDGGFIDAIHPDDREQALAAWNAAITARGSYAAEYRLRRADGAYAYTLARGSPIFEDGVVSEYIGCNVDITGLRSAEQTAREHAGTLGKLNEIGRLVSAEHDHHSIVHAVNEAATALTKAQFGAFFYNVLDARGGSYMLYTISGVPRERFSSFPMPRNTKVFAPTFSGDGVVRVDDITKDPRYGQNTPYHGMPEGHLPVRSYLAAPVVSRSGEVIGGIFLGHEDVAVFDERAEAVAMALAAQAAVAIDNARLYGEAKHLIRALEQSNRDLDQFAYVTSHDLKAPLRGISSLSEWLEEDLGAELRGDTKKHLDLLRGRVRRMEGLINGILDYSRIGRAAAKREDVDVARVLHDVVDLIGPVAPARIEIEGSMPTLFTERTALQQVFSNLIGNALKHALRPDVHVRVSARTVGALCEFSVADNGPGIPPAYQSRLWGIFQTLHERDKVESTGIGLAIVKKIVESRGGNARIESDGTSGATFLFTWPKYDPAETGAQDPLRS